MSSFTMKSLVFLLTIATIASFSSGNLLGYVVKGVTKNLGNTGAKGTLPMADDAMAKAKKAVEYVAQNKGKTKTNWGFDPKKGFIGSKPQCVKFLTNLYRSCPDIISRLSPTCAITSNCAVKLITSASHSPCVYTNAACKIKLHYANCTTLNGITPYPLSTCGSLE